MTKKTTTKEINYSLFLKKSQIDNLESLHSIEQKNWLEIKATFIATFNHVLGLVEKEVTNKKITLNRKQTVFNKSKEVFIKALKVAGLDEDFIYNNTRLVCHPQVVEKLTSDNPKEVLKALDKKFVDSLEDFKTKILDKPFKNDKKTKKEKEVSVELSFQQKTDLICLDLENFPKDCIKQIHEACQRNLSTTHVAKELVDETNIKDEQQPKVSIGKIETNKKTNKKTGTNG